MSTTSLNLDYHYGSEADAYSFYRIPKILFTDKRFATISVDAKVLYGLMLDRMSLSMKNSWVDKENRVFIYFTLDDAIEMLGCGHTKIIKLLSELDTAKGIGLIERKKQGQGKPTIIYVKSFTSLAPLPVLEKTEERKHYQFPNFKTSENEKSETATEDISATLAENFSQEDIFLPQNPVAAEVLTSKKRKSAHSQNRSLDFTNADTNKTKENKTECNNTHSINLSSSSQREMSESEPTMMDGLMDRISEMDLEDLVFNEIMEAGTLPYDYVSDERKMLAAIRLMTEYDHYQQNAETHRGNDFEFAVVKLFTEALTEMLTAKGNMTLKGSCVTYAKVYDKLLPYIEIHGTNVNIYSLLEIAKGDFTVACKQAEIKNHLQYMKSCIWNAMQVGDIGIQALIKKDFG